MPYQKRQLALVLEGFMKQRPLGAIMPTRLRVAITAAGPANRMSRRDSWSGFTGILEFLIRRLFLFNISQFHNLNIIY